MKYSIEKEPFPVLICQMEQGESMITESGSMAWMTPSMEMQTTSNGGVGKAFGRVFSGESLFMNRFTAGAGGGEIAFASDFMGSILAIEIGRGKPIIAQKSAFLAGTEGIDLSIHFQRKLSAGFFGGEGFIMQKISGEGIAFIEIDGKVIEYELAAGEQKILDTGYLAYMEETCTMEIVQNKGLKNKFFSGEGFFNTVVTGPGKIVIQTHPIQKVAQSISRYIVTSKG